MLLTRGYGRQSEDVFHSSKEPVCDMMVAWQRAKGAIERISESQAGIKPTTSVAPVGFSNH